MRKEILIIGTGGQGVKTLAEILGEAAAHAGFWPFVYPRYTPAARGGEITSSVVVTDRHDSYPLAEDPDIIVLLSPHIPEEFFSTKAHWIFDPAILPPPDVFAIKRGAANHMPLDGLIRDIRKNPSANLMILGVIQGLMPLFEVKNLLAAVKKILGAEKYPKNKKFLRQGRKMLI